MSANVKPPARAAATALMILACAQLAPVIARADPDPQPEPQPTPAAQQQGQELHNITYRARVDGVARGALITYKINDTQVRSADPTMLPGRIFEAQAVLSDPKLAGMQVSIQWPYSANLHCEILVDDATVAEADQFIRPRLTPADDDPDYGKLMCGAPLINAAAGPGNVVDTNPVDSPTSQSVAPDQPAA